MVPNGCRPWTTPSLPSARWRFPGREDRLRAREHTDAPAPVQSGFGNAARRYFNGHSSEDHTSDPGRLAIDRRPLCGRKASSLDRLARNRCGRYEDQSRALWRSCSTHPDDASQEQNEQGRYQRRKSDRPSRTGDRAACCDRRSLAPRVRRRQARDEGLDFPSATVGRARLPAKGAKQNDLLLKILAARQHCEVRAQAVFYVRRQAARKIAVDGGLRVYSGPSPSASDDREPP